MRRAQRALGLAPLVAVTGYAAPAIAFTSPGRRVFAAVTRTPARDAVALTFDDGPDVGLSSFLTVLAQRGASATFFVTGEQVRRDPALAREILSAGHEVGCHGFQHRLHLRLPPWAVVADLRRARDTIEDATQQPMRLFRPPYGLFSLASWLEADRLGWQRMLWSR